MVPRSEITKVGSGYWISTSAETFPCQWLLRANRSAAHVATLCSVGKEMTMQRERKTRAGTIFKWLLGLRHLKNAWCIVASAHTALSQANIYLISLHAEISSDALILLIHMNSLRLFMQQAYINPVANPGVYKVNNVIHGRSQVKHLWLIHLFIPYLFMFSFGRTLYIVRQVTSCESVDLEYIHWCTRI